jgi:hypothetical protein
MFVENVETGRIDLFCFGEDGYIKRAGKKIRIPSSAEKARIYEEFMKTKNRSKLEKFDKEYPKLENNDIIISGKKTKIRINVSWNKGKDKPIDDYKQRASKSVFMTPESELKVSGIEKWDKTAKEVKHCGEMIKNIELKKGFFHVSCSNTDDKILAETASIMFKNDGQVFIDVYENIIYSLPIKSSSIGAIGTEYTNKATGKTYLAKSSMFEEIIVSKDSIYKRALTKMDDIFNENMKILMSFNKDMMNSFVRVDSKQIAEQMKNIPANMENNMASLEMFKQMKPEDLERLMKISGNASKEDMEMVKNIPDMMKKMEASGMMEKRKPLLWQRDIMKEWVAQI